MTPLRPPLNVLLAEDDPVNRTLTMALLCARGDRVIAVTDGGEALNAMESAVFDVVLMDISMPGMDGIETTRIIRERERQTGRRVPVVALTAQVMTGDENRCLEAGMDAYLPKPFRRDDLYRVIDDVLGRMPGAVEEQQDDNELWEHDPELMKELLALLKRELPSLEAALDRAVATADRPLLKRTAHRLKGSLGMIGAHSVAALARDLERVSGTADIQEIEARSTGLRHAVGAFLARTDALGRQGP